MASTFTGPRGGSAVPVFRPTGSGLLAVAHGKCAIATNVVANDVFKLCTLPAGAVVVGGQFWATDLDTGTEVLDIDIGWAANGVEALSASGFVNSGVLSGDAVTDGNPAGVNMRHFNMSAGEITFSVDTVVQATANVAANTFAAGTIFVVVYYIVP